MAPHSTGGLPLQLTRGSQGFLLSHLESVPPAHFTDSVRQLEAEAEKSGIRAWTLMRRAGTAAWKLLDSRWEKLRHLTVLAGGGNNGGDGYVLAALAAQAGHSVKVVECAGRKKPSVAATQARAWALESGVEWLESVDWNAASDGSDCVVDALLGTGLQHRVRGEVLRLLCELETVDAPVLSLDVPSGLNADTGALLGPAPRARVTLTFIASKPGLWTGQGREHSGEIWLADLELPSAAASDRACPLLCTGSLRSLLPVPGAHAHKGTLGRVLVAGGDEGMGGAAILAAEAALYAGAGLVSAAVGAGTLPALLARRPEVMARVVNSGQDLEPMLESADTVVLGPGLGSGARAQQFVQRTIRHAASGRCRLVVDAGALRLLAPDSRWRRELPSGALLTPHPGEAAALLGRTIDEIQQDRPAAARMLSKQTEGAVILKGSGTLVAKNGGLSGICPSGNVGMATGGCGDVLAGVAGALMARGMAVSDAASLAVAAHAEAGDRLATLDGPSGLVAGNLAQQTAQLLDGR